MASVTLAESAKLSQNQLVAGVIENVITTNQMFEVFPFLGIEGNALAYNRENVLGDVQVAGIDDTITAKAAATFTQETASLTTIIGDAEVNGLIQATRSNITDQKAVQIASKAKSVGRKFQDMFINGDGTSNSFEGLLALLPTSQLDILATGANGADFDLSFLDILMDMVKDKDGEVDYFMMHSRTLRSYYAALRALGGASIGDVVTLPSGRQLPGYRNVPIFRNDWIPVDQDKGSATGVCTTIFAGTFDDGSQTVGASGITAEMEAGIRVQEVGPSETKDNDITRVKWYCGLALFSELGIAGIDGVKN